MYDYYDVYLHGLFTCTNLVDVMPLFFMIFSFHLSILAKIVWFLKKFTRYADFLEKSLIYL
jgi:hypothetical protein